MLAEWNAEHALAAPDIEQISFTHTDGNCQGYARLCCRQHNYAYVAKSVMWRSAFLAISQQQTSDQTPYKFKAQSAQESSRPNCGYDHSHDSGVTDKDMRTTMI